MGSGKSAIGRNLARRLNMRFMDADRAIERQTGRTIQELFASEGEERFREIEREFIRSGHPARGCIVACGGGLLQQPGMSGQLQSKGEVFCLFASPETLHRRTSRTNKRPLLQVSDPETRIKELLTEREPAYLRAGTGICTENRAISDVAAHIARLYKLKNKERSRQI